MDALNQEIASCELCPARLIVHKWLPVGYFGAYRQANAWVVSINPSHREFLARDGHLLRGNEQRFSVLDDDPTCTTRPAYATGHLSTILDRQDNFYHRNPYRGFFNRLGSFLLQVHQVQDSEPLRAFRAPLPGGWFYCHMDIVKCATRQRWSNLALSDRTLLRRNCQSYLAQQLQFAPQLRLILVNGKSAMESVQEAFASLGFIFASETAQVEDTRVTIWSGSAPVYPDARFLGWSANVVNGHLLTGTKTRLAELVRSRLSIPAND